MEPLFWKLESFLEKGVAASSGSPASLNCCSSSYPQTWYLSQAVDSFLLSLFPNLPKELNHLGAFVKATYSQIPSLESLSEWVWGRIQDAMFVTSISDASYQRNMGNTALGSAVMSIF